MYGYHFVREDLKLGYGDGRIVIVGEKLTVDCEPILCEQGLHASKSILDALQYAPGPMLCRVRLFGQILHSDDKSVATERKVLWMFDATDLLRYFSRWCAAQVVHLWDAPDVVKEFLRTGDEELRAEAYKSAKAHAEAGAKARAKASKKASEVARAEASMKAGTKADARVSTGAWGRASAKASTWASLTDRTLAPAYAGTNAYASTKANAYACAGVKAGANAEPRHWDSAYASAWDSAEREFLRLVPLARAGRLPTEVVIPEK